MEMSDLPKELVEEILSKIPVTCMRSVRLTCKKWNDLSKTRSFVEKHIGEETSRKSSVIMTMNQKVYLLGVSFSGIHNKFDTSIKHKGTLIIRNNNMDSEPLVLKVFHGDGLFLFVMVKRVVVWNPYLGQVKWIQARDSYYQDDFAMGYAKKDKSHSHKIFRISNVNSIPYEIYDFKSDSWKVLGITPLEEDVFLCYDALSLKGNSYWVAREKIETRNKKFLICFDFTEERLGPRLSFPFDSYFEDIVILSSFGEEQIAVLFKKWGKFEMKIWVTSKINPTTVSWSKFLEVDMRPFITGCNHVFTQSRGFFIDEEKKVVVVFGRHEFDDTRKIAYIIGEDGYFRKVDLGEDTNIFSHQHVRSYVPSSVHINHPFC
ncbi:hypothetical protein IGI04_007753 [Brassica rapa subsp. trilocularis]|uniref:F-box domain-containing protein n=2 Tax=Brassica campestris TaxID=3711 RepID=A0A3P6APV1_BRACM|nr:hypothetical protein IGI04_007753 [Brassica rapa subsp. trilocularis]CAG7894929.1 unnamed protein product [Brassica rapa]VDC91059.1 unnamed protein product [Brassica rapa]